MQDRHDLQRVSTTGVHHPTEERQRLGGVAGVDRIGEVPRRHSPGVAEERLDLGEREHVVGAVGAGERGQDAVEASGVLTEPGTELVSRIRLDAQPRVLDAVGDPLLAILGPRRR